MSAIDVECGASAEAPEALSRVQENTRDRLIYALWGELPGTGRWAVERAVASAASEPPTTMSGMIAG